MSLKDDITIVVPCKNEESYILHLLNSLRNQKGIDGVRIIIADKSTDNTRKIIEQYTIDLNVEVIEGGPVSQAKNAGAKLVTTPYILFIDADVRFFSQTVLADTVRYMKLHKLELLGLNARCYDGSIKTQISFTIFNHVNKILSKFIPFAVGAYMLTRTDKFNQLGGFPEKYATSEDFHLSRKFRTDRFAIYPHYFGQDSRRFKKMGYFGMTWYLIKNFINMNNKKHWEKINDKDYWG